MLSVMFAVLDVTRLPEASSTLTLGWVPQAVPSTPPPGWVLRTSCVAGPKVMENVLLVAVPRPVALAVRE